MLGMVPVNEGRKKAGERCSPAFFCVAFGHRFANYRLNLGALASRVNVAAVLAVGFEPT